MLELRRYVVISATLLLPIALTACAVYAATMVSLCAGVRSGAPRLLYVAMACAVPAIAFALTLAASIAIPLALCAAIGFIALRQYGEALARYDPL